MAKPPHALMRVGFYLGESQNKELDEAADELEMGKSEIAREALEDWFMRHRMDAPVGEQEWREWRTEYLDRLYELLDEFENQAIARGEKLGERPQRQPPRRKRTTRKG